MTGINRYTYGLVVLLVSLVNVDAHSNSEHDLEFSARIRAADLETNGISGKAVSGLARLSLRSDWFDGFSSFVEIDHVETGYKEEHSDGVRFNGQPLIPDVPGTDVNQFNAKLDFGLWSFTLGRQTVSFDNQRFVGSVNVWQNEQSFDALLVEREVLTTSRAQYVYIDNANRIFGDDAGPYLSESDVNFIALNGRRPLKNLGDHKQNTHLWRLELNELDYSKFVLYSYLINNKDAAAVSSDTIGGQYRFKIKPNVLQYRFELEAALQERTGLAASPNVSYFRVDGSVAFQSLELSLQQERLGSNDGASFVTPLATLHDFNGWADKFGLPPATGLVDNRLKVTWRVSPFKFDLRYHQFSADKGGADFGDELDFDIIYKPAEKHHVVFRFSDFRAANNEATFTDERRLILHYAYNFSGD